ncbi:MAG: helix-turn-helix transcriptional regulator [Saonia sp.]
MKKELKVRDLEAKDVIIDMSKSLGVDYEEENNEFCIRLPEEIGSGYIKATCFDYGISVIQSDYLLKTNLHLELEKGVINPLKIIFNRESAFSHSFSEEDESHEIRHLESVVTSATPKNVHLFKIPANTPICMFSIEINRKLFEEKIETFLEEMNDNLVELFRDVNGINLFFYKGFYSLDIAKFMEEYMDCDLEGFMRSVYLEGKTYEILIHYLRQYLDDLNDPDGRKILRQATVERIEEAAKIIEEELAVMDSVIKLAKRVGVNQNTLQAGFQQLYNTSVNEYIRNFRIEKAKELLEKSDLNVTEITYRIGINSRSYFSKLFKERYGVSPGQYLSKHRIPKKNSKSA